MKSRFFVLICLITFGLNPILAQEDCVTAIPIPISTLLGGTNVGSIIDNDYSAITGCAAQNYNSSVWYSFTTPAGATTLSLSFTPISLGTQATVTIVDDCTSNSSYSYI